MSAKKDLNRISESPHQVSPFEEVVDAPEIVSSGMENKESEPEPPEGFNKELEALIQSIIVDPEAEAMEPPTAISVDQLPICTLGNFSLVIGGPKSHKTFFVSAVAAAAASGGCEMECITGSMPPDSEVHYFDTEQSTYDLHKTVNRIVVQSRGYNFKAYEMRPLSPNQRLKVIEYTIERMNNPGFIIIDGLRDLLTTGINDETEATNIMSNLLKWTHKKNSHIMLVLHQNKNNANARGHIGTEAVNKAETVLRLVNKTGYTKVFPEFCRSLEFEQFSFMINSEGLPEIIDSMAEIRRIKKLSHLQSTFETILPGTTSMPYGDLAIKIKEIEEVEVATAKRRIKAALDEEIITQDENGHYMLKNEVLQDEEVTV